MRIDLDTTCKLLLDADDILILTHRKPDGDTLGAGFALLFALESLGKRARLECPDPLPSKYRFLFGEYAPQPFEEAFIVAVDIASLQLLTGLQGKYGNRINLCIDHHHSNQLYARHSWIDSTAPAASQMMYHVVKGLGVEPDKAIANALYTGITTDTGGFRFADVTPETHRIAADLIEYGAEFSEINRMVFETKTRGRLMVDRLVIDSLTYHFEGYCACVVLPGNLKEVYQVSDDELEGLSSIPRTIDKVVAGVTVFDQGDGTFRASLRTFDPVDASRICEKFGGGGHVNAAGCTLRGTAQQVQEQLLGAVKTELEQSGLWTESY